MSQLPALYIAMAILQLPFESEGKLFEVKLGSISFQLNKLKKSLMEMCKSNFRISYNLHFIIQLIKTVAAMTFGQCS